MTGTVYTPLLGRLNQRLFPLTKDEFNSVLTVYGTVFISPSTLSAYALLAGTQTLTGTNVFTAPVRFKDLPWADVTGYGAVGDHIHDDTTAIQSAINHMVTNYSGGIIFFPPGNYRITTAVTVSQAAVLMGSGRGATAINGKGQDSIAVYFDVTASDAEMTQLSVFGYNNTAATTDAVVIAGGAQVDIRDCVAQLGRYGLNTAGVDCRVYDTYPAGYTG